MEDDGHELIRRLFALLSADLETAHDLSIHGQADLLSMEDQSDLARRINAAICELAALAGALVVLTAPARMAACNPEVPSEKD